MRIQLDQNWTMFLEEVMEERSMALSIKVKFMLMCFAYTNEIQKILKN